MYLQQWEQKHEMLIIYLIKTVVNWKYKTDSFVYIYWYLTVINVIFIYFVLHNGCVDYRLAL